MVPAVPQKGRGLREDCLERTKGSTLDIASYFAAAVNAIRLLPPHTKQIRSLNINYNDWADILRFSELNSGPFPLLHTFEITCTNDMSLGATIPSSLLFGNAVDLCEFESGSELLRLSKPHILRAIGGASGGIPGFATT